MLQGVNVDVVHEHVYSIGSVLKQFMMTYRDPGTIALLQAILDDVSESRWELAQGWWCSPGHLQELV